MNSFGLVISLTYVTIKVVVTLTLLDLGSREIVGYALSQSPHAQLARQALINVMTIKQLKTSQHMFHPDDFRIDALGFC